MGFVAGRWILIQIKKTPRGDGHNTPNRILRIETIQIKKTPRGDGHGFYNFKVKLYYHSN